MTRPLPKKITFQTPIKYLRVEQCGKLTNSWLLWLTANADFTLGSYVKLSYDGKMYLTTLHPDGTVTEVEITE